MTINICVNIDRTIDEKKKVKKKFLAVKFEGFVLFYAFTILKNLNNNHHY